MLNHDRCTCKLSLALLHGLHKASASCTLNPLPLLQADSEFVDMLAAVRSGSCAAAGGSAVVRQLVLRCSRPLDTSDGILPTNVSPARFVSPVDTRQACPGLQHPVDHAARLCCTAAAVTLDTSHDQMPFSLGWGVPCHIPL